MAFDRPTRLLCCAVLLAAAGITGCSSPKPEIPSPSPSAPAPTPGKALAKSTVLFEATGTGTVYTIDTDPASAQRIADVALPWQSTITIGPDVHMLQVVVVGRNDGDGAGPGCRITLDGTVVAEEPVGGSAHCIYEIP